MESIGFSFAAKEGAITYSIEGMVDATVIANKQLLDSAVIRNFVDSNKECREYKSTYGFINLMKLREAVMVFLRTEFKSYKIEKMKLIWLNGSDTISLG